MSSLTRRDFAKAAAAIGITAAGVTSAAAATTRNATSTRKATSFPANGIRLGVIGLGNRGDRVLDAFLAQDGAVVVALCDVYRPYLDFAAEKVGSGAAQYTDYRQILDRKDVDAVVINTPDHWHALQTIHACQAGKDVYVEKPLSLTIAEGRAMANAAKHYKRVTQVGVQRRSSKFCRERFE